MITNFEKIKNMNIDEFLNFWLSTSPCKVCPYERGCVYPITLQMGYCKKGLREYLESEEE